MAERLIALDFEVFGKVQGICTYKTGRLQAEFNFLIISGVSFRKYALDAANKFIVRGWCKNTEQGTVTGQMQGTSCAVDRMKNWLQKVGSPYSKIERADFANETEIPEFSYESFTELD